MIKRLFTLKRFYAALLFIAFGLMFIFVPSKYLTNIVLRIVGVLITLAGIVKLTFVNKNSMGTKEYLFDWFEGVTNILIGVTTFKFYDYPYVTLTCGLIYIIVPSIRFILAKRKVNQLLVDSLKYLGFLVLISSFNKMITSKFVIAPVFFGCAIFICVTIVVNLINYRKEALLNEPDEIVGC